MTAEIIQFGRTSSQQRKVAQTPKISAARRLTYVEIESEIRALRIGVILLEDKFSKDCQEMAYLNIIQEAISQIAILAKNAMTQPSD